MKFNIKILPRYARCMLYAAIAATTLPTTVLAQAQAVFPNKAVRWVIPYAAGGSADLRARQIGSRLSEMWGQPVIYENKAGAGGVLGTDLVAKAASDGYTIGMGNFAPLAINPTLMKSLPYNVARDFAPVILIERGPLVLMVNPATPAKSVKELIALAKAKPGMGFASSGNGGSHHLSGEMFKAIAGIEIQHVPYKGGAPAASDLMGGHVDMMFELTYAALPAIKGGKLRPLAVTSSERLSVLPDVPTMIESGMAGFESSNWQGVIAPVGTPRDIVQKLNADINKVLAMPEVRNILVGQGNQVGGGTPEDFAAMIKAETVKWAKVIKDAKIQSD
ncbi:MAG: tripartite tricarboxylate transporter substrate binding protein [Betaproteobacteria bacterium]